VEDHYGPYTRITDEHKHQEALSKAKEMKAKQEEAETATLGRTFMRDADKANAFSKLSRYETTIERSLYKALHELQRLQPTRRAEGNAPPPAAIDVDVSGVSGKASRNGVGSQMALFRKSGRDIHKWSLGYGTSFGSQG
jgi:hypothetical protein